MLWPLPQPLVARWAAASGARLAPLSLPGIWQLLERFDIAYKRGRRYVHSPDPDYPVKAARLRSAWQEVLKEPMRCVLLYQDELTYYRCPTVYCDYTMAGSDAPRAAQGTGYNTSRRIAGCLMPTLGRTCKSASSSG